MRFGSFRFAAALIVASLALGSAAFADATPGTESTPIPTNTKPDWSSMKFLLGTWSCSTKRSRRPTPYSTTSTSAMDDTGYWMVTKSVSPKVSWAPGINAVDMVTYDPQQKRWVDVYTDNLGGYDVTYSPGWKGNSAVWTDVLFQPGPDVMTTTPTTNTKVSDTKYTSSSSFTEKSGRKVTVIGTCTKGGSM